MIDINYLGHDFMLAFIDRMPNDYDCKTCRIKIYFDKLNNKYYFASFNYRGFVEIDITCKEQQIKNLLE